MTFLANNTYGYACRVHPVTDGSPSPVTRSSRRSRDEPLSARDRGEAGRKAGRDTLRVTGRNPGTSKQPALQYADVLDHRPHPQSCEHAQRQRPVAYVTIGGLLNDGEGFPHTISRGRTPFPWARGPHGLWPRVGFDGTGSSASRTGTLSTPSNHVTNKVSGPTAIGQAPMRDLRADAGCRSGDGPAEPEAVGVCRNGTAPSRGTGRPAG